jgi:hypothetical protein
MTSHYVDPTSGADSGDTQLVIAVLSDDVARVKNKGIQSYYACLF